MRRTIHSQMDRPGFRWDVRPTTAPADRQHGMFGDVLYQVILCNVGAVQVSLCYDPHFTTYYEMRTVSMFSNRKQTVDS